MSIKQRKTQALYLSDKEQKATMVFLSRLASEDIFPSSMILFGSKARGDYDAESDVDLLLILPEGSNLIRDRVRDVAADVSVDFSTYLSTRVWGAAYLHEQSSAETSLYREIRKDDVELLPTVA